MIDPHVVGARRARVLILFAAATVLAGCGSAGLAPVVSRTPVPAADRSAPPPGAPAPRPERAPAPTSAPAFHVVARGDTLYSIAWRYGLDYRAVARWNEIGPPYLIVPGQRIALRPQSSTAPAPASSRAAPPAPSAAPQETAAAGGEIRWRWPAHGEVREADTPFGKRGIQIKGRRGQPVHAAAAGKVVYSGSGLIGYGKLIIIKHNDTYLSAYAHNDTLLVSEGASVAAGQKIAEMGSSGTKEVMLHFEIRRDGKPVPPLALLPAS